MKYKMVLFKDGDARVYPNDFEFDPTSLNFAGEVLGDDKAALIAMAKLAREEYVNKFGPLNNYEYHDRAVDQTGGE